MSQPPKTLPLWVDSFVRFWPVVLAASLFLAAAISRDLANSAQIDAINKYGADYTRQQIDRINTTNDRIAETLTRITQVVDDTNKRVGRIEDKVYGGKG